MSMQHCRVNIIIIILILQMKELSTEKFSKLPTTSEIALELWSEPRESGSRAYELNHYSSCHSNTRGRITKIIFIKLFLSHQFPVQKPTLGSDCSSIDSWLASLMFEEFQQWWNENPNSPTTACMTTHRLPSLQAHSAFLSVYSVLLKCIWCYSIHNIQNDLCSLRNFTSKAFLLLSWSAEFLIAYCYFGC